MALLDRITHNPNVMGGKPCIRGMRVTAGMILGMLAAGHSAEEILRLYPYLESDDIRAALEYAAWRAKEEAFPLPTDEAADRHEPVAGVVREAPDGGI
jgi:uncharacterized protein (DUF433 family)